MLTLIVPMAGSAERFGGAFKPFLHVGDEYFIDAMMRPFRKAIDQIDHTVFIVRRDHEDGLGVHQRLTERFADFSPTVVVLDKSTSGPVQTVRHAVVEVGLTGGAIVCDCDHALDVASLLERFRSNDGEEAVVPVWPISPDDASDWCVAEVDDDSFVVSLSEKAWPSQIQHAIAGVIGCYALRRIELLRASTDADFSSVLSRLILEQKKVGVVVPTWAEFFGDPLRLETASKSRQQSNYE